MNFAKSLPLNPYQLFFPMAWAHGVWGGLMWIANHASLIDYPFPLHPQTMVGGFLFGHVVGFLLTAGTRFTGTGPLTWLELGANLVSFLSLSFFANAIDPRLFFANLGVCGVLLAATLAGRFARRTKNPPPQFVFVPFGLAALIIGSALLAVPIENESIYRFAHLCAHEAFILSLVLGIGGRLVPFLLGQATDPSIGDHKKIAPLWPFLALLWITYLAESLHPDAALTRIVRACIVFSLMARDWRILKLPVARTRQTWGLWISAWMIIAGLLASATSGWRVHGLHLFYIGGLGLLTLMIATRVALAHGSGRLDLERTSHSLPLIVVLVILSAVTRWTAGLFPSLYISHLSYAAGAWVLALLLWGAAILWQGLQSKEQVEP